MSTQVFGLSKEEEQSVADEATVWMEQAIRKGASALDDLLGETGRLGLRSEEQAGRELGLLEYTAHGMLERWSALPELLHRLREEGERLSEGQHVGFIGKMLRRNRLKHYVNGYHAVRCNLDAIVTELREQREALEQHGAGMLRLKQRSVEELQELPADIAFGNKLKELLAREAANPGCEQHKATLEHGVSRIKIRIRSLNGLMRMYEQVGLAADLFSDYNDRLMNAVNNAIDRTSNLTTVSAMLAMFLADREEGIFAPESADGTPEFPFAENARLLRTAAGPSELLPPSPLSLETAKRAIGRLLAALDGAGQLCGEVLSRSRSDMAAITAIHAQFNHLHSGSGRSKERANSAVE